MAPSAGIGAGSECASAGIGAGSECAGAGIGAGSECAGAGIGAGPEFAPAKINLCLHVTGRRADGYHLLDSLVVFADVGDRLWLAPGEGFSLDLTGPEAGSLEPGSGDNLVLRAARLGAEAGFARGGRFVLEKNLPVASGIGGGSADAAAALRLSAAGRTVPAALALGLGADVPVCLASVAARMRGVGDIVDAAPTLPPLGIVLANPRLPLATAAVFKARTGEFGASCQFPPRWADAAAVAADLRHARNDLEAAAVSLCPPVADVLAALAALPGALLARMSGSGATCFALLGTPAAAHEAAQRLPTAWWRWGGGLYAPGRKSY